jgi:DNA-binding beta-propeller fold protein YncE
LHKTITAKIVTLPNGWNLSTAGRSIPLSYLPLNMAVSTSKKLMAVSNNGQSMQSIQLINPATEKVLDNVIVPKNWYGLKFSADEKYLYASGGNDNWVLKYALIKNKLVLSDSILLDKNGPTKFRRLA